MPRDDASARPLRLTLASMSWAPFFGGAALRFSRYLAGFGARGVRAEVFTSVPRGTGDAESATVGASLPPIGGDHGTVHRVVLPAERTRWRFRHYFGALSRHCAATPPDVLHLLNLHWLATLDLWRLRRRGVAVIFSDTLIQNVPRSGFQRLLARVTVALPFRAVDAVVVSTSVMAEALRALGVRTRIEEIANGVDLARFRPPKDPAERAALRGELGLPHDAEIVLCVGAVERRKRVDLLIEAWARHAAGHPERHLVIVGPVSTRYQRAGAADGDPYHRELEAQVERSGAAERVHFAGEVEAVERYYRAADVFVLTSRREGMNNAVFEAMATGVPVVLVPFVGLAPAHGRPGVEFVLAEAEPDALADALRELAGDARRRQALAEAGLAWAREHMDVERVQDRYVALYRELAGRSGDLPSERG